MVRTHPDQVYVIGSSYSLKLAVLPRRFEGTRPPQLQRPAIRSTRSARELVSRRLIAPAPHASGTCANSRRPPRHLTCHTRSPVAVHTAAYRERLLLAHHVHTDWRSLVGAIESLVKHHAI